MSYEIAPIGQGFLWMGVYSMLFFSGFHARSILCLPEKTLYNYAFRITLFVILCITFVCHLFTALLLLSDVDPDHTIDPHHIVHAEWLLTTPLFILLICWLANSRRIQTAFLVGTDVLMIGSGIAAYNSPTETQFWQLLLFSGCVWLFLISQLLKQVYFVYYDGLAIRMMFINRTLFAFIVALITVSWNAYIVIMILKRNNTIDLTTEFILYIVFDCLNKGVYGLLFLGAKEVAEKMESRLANYTRSLASILPNHAVYKRLASSHDSIPHEQNSNLTITIPESPAQSQKIESVSSNRQFVHNYDTQLRTTTSS